MTSRRQILFEFPTVKKASIVPVFSSVVSIGKSGCLCCWCVACGVVCERHG
ncbi:hypothetical protein FGIG_02758 [Fasciola gigantica]|uniref:Uncharacterized protein n=1 Tax=Fasciola gigantica TaxID=46835 RepID=A0A504Z6P9_FASGI|nr:hypothetical protein FGIG_02758 [Fasciola gigantica]